MVIRQSRSPNSTTLAQQTLHLLCLTGIFKNPQRANGGIEKRQQMHDEDIVEEQFPVAVWIGFPQVIQERLQRTDVPATLQLRWPNNFFLRVACPGFCAVELVLLRF